jgi:pimeloyl-ACP methyl ester carboxylesterase
LLRRCGYRDSHNKSGEIEVSESANRPGASVSQGMLDQFWLWSMQGGLKNIYDSIKAFSETDFTEDLKKFDVPTLVMHGEDDQVVPIKDSAKKSPGSSRERRKFTIRAGPTVSRLRTRMK